MKKIIDWLVPNALIIMLFIILAIEMKEIFGLGEQGSIRINIDYLLLLTPLTIVLLLSSLYALIKNKPKMFNWIALISFICITILSIIIYTDKQELEALILPILCLGLLISSIIKLINDNKDFIKKN